MRFSPWSTLHAVALCLVVACAAPSLDDQPAASLDGSSPPIAVDAAPVPVDGSSAPIAVRTVDAPVASDRANDAGAVPRMDAEPPDRFITHVKLPVFPGAEGFGSETIAGRQGRIIHVTNLNDDGPGSLRAALWQKGPRVVVFDVGGTIRVRKHISVDAPYLTIAGQTAPSPGITLRDGHINIQTHDVLVQHIRVRTGDQGADSGDATDAFQVLRPETNNVYVDHCSFGWAVDENVSVNYQAHNITFRNIIVSEGLNNSKHGEGPHSMGVLFGNNVKNGALIGSLLAHNADRHPFIKGGAEVVVINNVFYNWSKPHGTRLGSTDSASYPILASLVGNVYIKGADTPANSYAISIHPRLRRGSFLHHRDNIVLGVPAFLNEAGFDPSTAAPPIWASPLTLRPARDVEAAVLRSAGARPVDRDAVDRRIVEEARTRTGRIIDSPDQVGGWPNVNPTSRPFVPPANPEADDDRDGYTNLEEVLHRLAADLEAA